MKADYIYFGENGLTNTSANHVANMAKESIKNVASELEAISFYSMTVSLISGGTRQQAKIGSTREQLDGVLKSLETVGEANALIAWLREAIKARERLLTEVKDMTLETYCRDILGGVEIPQPDKNILYWIEVHGYTLPDVNGEFPGVNTNRIIGNAVSRIENYCKKFGLTMPTQPKKEEAMTEDQYMATLSVKDRNRILTLGAKASSIGKYIHENGHLYKERELFRQTLAHPIYKEGEGANLLLGRYEPSVTPDEVEALFFRLAAEHRAIQAELNGLLAERDRTIEADKQKKAAEWQEAQAAYSREINSLQRKVEAYMTDERNRMGKYQVEFDAWSTEQQSRHKQLCADLEAWKLSEAKRIASLGIIIPNELLSIYERINGFGK
jgi:hypothetical protein